MLPLMSLLGADVVDGASLEAAASLEQELGADSAMLAARKHRQIHEEQQESRTASPAIAAASSGSSASEAVAEATDNGFSNSLTAQSE
jgi:hypothetical protein